MGKRLGRILAALLIVSALGFGVRRIAQIHQEKSEAEQSYQTLALACSKGVPIPRFANLDWNFEVLLSNPYGHPWIRRLEESYPSVAFYEKRNAVFYLQEQAKLPDDTRDSRFAFIMDTVTGPEGGKANVGAHFGPGFLLKKVRVEGDQVVVDFEMSKDEKKPLVEKGNTFEPGGRYVTRMDVAEVLRPSEPATHIYELFFPKAQRQ